MLDELRQKPFSMLQAIFIRDSLTSPLALYALTNCFLLLSYGFFFRPLFSVLITLIIRLWVSVSVLLKLIKKIVSFCSAAHDKQSLRSSAQKV